MSAAVHWAPWALLLAGITALGLRELSRALRKHPPPGVRGPTPQGPRPAAGRGAQLPVPGHRTPIAKRIHVHTCGCIWASPGPGRWERTYDCQALDGELRRLTDDQH